MPKNYDFNEVETKILEFWIANDIYKKSASRNKGKTKFYFLQGPPYTSGRLHIGHAWNNSLKDLVIRYKRMKGFDVWDRGGYDMHGLPTENKVQEKFKLKTKKDILEFGMEKFIKECLKFSKDNAALMNTDLFRLAVWMDHENAYMPIHNSFIEGEWFLIKKVHEKNRLYKGKKVMTWCKNCETALAKHELEYENVKDDSIFVKFQVANKHNEFLIIWTTTPWTIPYNLAVMVNPELDYVKVKVDDEIWIVAKALAGAFIGGALNKNFEIIEEFLGEKLDGLKYKHPMHNEIKFFDEFEKANPKNRLHTVLLSKEYVDTTAGTGLVHCAPGCGPEDFEVGKSYGLPPFNELDERGIFSENMGKFFGMVAKENDNYFTEVLKEKGVLLRTAEIEHEYAFCWRCHKPVIFRATEQWFFKIEDLKEKLLYFNKDVKWVPESGKTSMDMWVKNLKDNSITRQRFWGSPVPIWECQNEKCKKYVVIGSAAELKALSGKIPDNLHKPWIDEVTIKCDCGALMKRIPDVIDVWIDAGTASWNCLDYPENPHLFEKYYPADFILEATEQVRLWFSMLQIASALAFDSSSYKNVYMHGMILDYQGLKMSKSQGNIISPYEVVEKNGADVLRYYMCGITAGENINFSWDEVKLKHKNLFILWNIHNFLIDFMKINELKLDKNAKLEIEEKYIISRLNSTIKKVTSYMDKYYIDKIFPEIENLYLDLSRTYIQLIREKAVIGTEPEKKAILYTIHEVLYGILKMFSIISPFITEQIYQNMKTEFGYKEESIHFENWPEYNEKMIDENLEKHMEIANIVIQSIFSAREKMHQGVRWPLHECVVDTDDATTIDAVESLKELIKKQTNIKNINVKIMDVDLEIKPNFKNLGKDFGNLTQEVVKIIEQSNVHIIEHMKNTPHKSIKIEGYEIKKEHFEITKKVPADYESSEFGKGAVYLSRKITPELEAEGFAREITRRVQQLRKDSGLNKKDVIELTIVIDNELKERIKHFENQIKEKVGAEKLHFLENKHGKFEFSSEEKIKNYALEIMFNKK